MKYNPTIHHRRSIRLKGYDYSQAGLYFVTICTQNRQCLFGNIVGADLRVCPDKSGEHDILGEHNKLDEHDISGESHRRITDYIIYNPTNWGKDKFYTN